MMGATLLLAIAAAVPSKSDVRAAAYIGSNGGIYGDRACAADPNIAQVRNVRCRPIDEPAAAACDYQLRTPGARWQQVSDVFYRAPNGKRWYLDDNDDDDDKARR